MESSLFEDIKREQFDLSQELSGISSKLLSDARAHVEKNGICKAVVAVVTTGETVFIFPQWDSDAERGRIFDSINEELALENCDATLCAFGGSYVQSPDQDVDVRAHPEATPAIVMITRTSFSKLVNIHPYIRHKTGIEWIDSVEFDSFPLDPIRYPCAD